MIRFEKIFKTYPVNGKRIPALQTISLSVPAGQMTAISGGSGAGKSTLLNICGLVDYEYRGKLFINGQKMSVVPGEAVLARREYISFVFERCNLIPVMNIYENLEYPLILKGMEASERQTLVDAMVAKLDLQGLCHKMPADISLYEQQRIAVARAMIAKPLVVVADEPTADLNDSEASIIAQLLVSMSREIGATLLVATNCIAMQQRCDVIQYLDQGHVVSEPMKCAS
ncbi:ABC transporter ATP-binding protein YtrE [Vibrio stylophorae]|uniref:ABC transporter ATP-binding protein YtrE n=1 Tax=Vibrio stylophorae TaxID=659351 RepID=A0ABM8ZXZ7_9VIBR|nr:ATP-binding cassette domain-containing protein [Vibrio stylophorae]CAH0535704.1 ABC transporter ATP-binding protein YtrE [Vibrio stylophorae]